jgi:uncharacterized protein (TIGR03437 family)
VRLSSLLAFFLLALTLQAQTPRLTGRIDDSRRVVLNGNRHPGALPGNDRGAVDPRLRLENLVLHFKPTTAQQGALDRLLEDQQNPASPEYHQWLTPDEYADRFGVSASDFDKVALWLEAQGFSINYKARGRMWLGFSGDAAQVQSAFRTEIHHYIFNNGEPHFANAADPSIPEALAPLVRMIGGLDDVRLKPHSRLRPLFNVSDGSHAVTPGDLATIYNMLPLFAKGIDGSGQKLVIVGQTAITMADIQNFRATFGLSATIPQLVLVPGYSNPGVVNSDLGEALLDLEYSGGIARGATLVYVYAPDVFTSLEYAIDQNLAPVISMSYGGCELQITAGPSTTDALRLVAQQANAEGITWVAASGDSGAADCELQGSSPAGTHGVAVDVPASVPEVTAVGGTEFNEGSGTFWNSVGVNGSSAQRYIPERVWNDTVVEGGLASSGGGASIFYPKPSWQTGPGVPNDRARDVPDVAVTASWTHDPYVMAIGGGMVGNGGTSAAAPVFAGILTLLNQYQVVNAKAKPGLGNINPNLYRLAQTTAGIFHDITVGNNIVPCTPRTTGCANGSYGYNAGTGYDLATGLGSVDVNNFVTLWGGAPATTPTTIPTTTTITAVPAAVAVNASTILTATVRAASGSASPTGAITFNSGKTALGSATLSGAGGLATASVTIFGSQLSAGANQITATYGGTTTFLTSAGSTTVTVNVPTTASAVVPSIVPTPIYQQDPDADGYAWFYAVRLSEIGGTATSITSFSIAGTDHTADIVTFFGSATLPARGTLTANIRSIGLTVPVDRVFTFSGTDASGQRWTQQLTVPFLPQQISASMLLSSSPGTEVQNPKGDPACAADHPFYQQLNLEELNGVGVQLTGFFAAGSNLTDSITTFFGSQRLAPLGTLRANICWRITTLPDTLKYEVDGIDTAGKKITTTLSVPFQAAGQTAGALTASKTSLSVSAAAGQTTTTSVNVALPAAEKWSVSLFPLNQKTSWLVVYPQSGVGPATVNLVASAGGIPTGVYTANLVFQSVNTIPQFVNVSITFTVGLSTTTAITGVSNGASFQQSFAPGMILSVFGTRLANSIKQAPSVPLPTVMDGVTVTVNGTRAPLYYISPIQLNVQLPYETAAGTAVLGVNNNGQVTSTTFSVKPTGPGIFTAGNGALVPIPSARRGESILLYVTGEGDTSPMIGTGAPPSDSTPLDKLPAPRQSLTMTIGGVPVSPFFVGIPYGLVGVTQVNFTVPANAPLGLQPVIVTVGGVASKAVALNVTAASAAAVFQTETRALPTPLPVRELVQDAPWKSGNR